MRSLSITILCLGAFLRPVTAAGSYTEKRIEDLTRLRQFKIIDAGVHGAAGKNTQRPGHIGEWYFFTGTDISPLPIPKRHVRAFEQEKEGHSYRVTATADAAPISVGFRHRHQSSSTRIAVWRHGDGPPDLYGKTESYWYSVMAVSSNGRYVAGKRTSRETDESTFYLLNVETGAITTFDPPPLGAHGRQDVVAVNNDGDVLFQMHQLSADAWPAGHDLTGTLGAIWDGERYTPLFRTTEDWHVLLRKPVAWNEGGVITGRADMVATHGTPPDTKRVAVRYPRDRNEVGYSLKYNGRVIDTSPLHPVDINKSGAILTKEGYLWRPDSTYADIPESVGGTRGKYQFIAVTDRGVCYATAKYRQRLAKNQPSQKYVSAAFVPDNVPPKPQPPDNETNVGKKQDGIKKKVAIFFHGWRTTPESLRELIAAVSYAMKQDGVRDEWKFVVVDWRSLAGYKKDGFAKFGPFEAAKNGVVVGRIKATEVIHSDLEVARVYGHSAGRYPANACAQLIKKDTDAHVTLVLLDAYEADRTVPREKTVGEGLDRAVHYLDSFKRDAERDLVFAKEAASWTLRKKEDAEKGEFYLGGVTGPVYRHCVNIDVTELKPPKDRMKKMKDLSVLQIVEGSLIEPWSAHHAWPVKAYGSGVLDQYDLGTARGEGSGEPYGTLERLEELDGYHFILKRGGGHEIRRPYDK